MSGQTSESLSPFDTARLRPRYWVNFGLLSLITVLRVLRFRHRGIPAGRARPAMAPHLRIIRGHSLQRRRRPAICGAVIWVSLADAWGRKRQLVPRTFICGIGAR